MPPHHETAVLENGLRVVTVELPHLHTVTLAIYLKVGSRFETPEQNGLSHFVEHMLFRGTERHPTSLDLNFAFERLGGSLYAETGRDYSLFQTAVEPDAAGTALGLFGEVFGRPRFSDIELERALVLEELNEDYDERGAEINGDDIARGLIFGDHSLGQRIIGSRENVRSFGEADVRAHFARYYGARNMIACVAGPVAAEEAIALARRHLGRLPAGEPASSPPPEPFAGGPVYRYVADSGSQTSVHVVLPGVPELDPDFPAQTALLRALDDGMATRLHYRLCDQLALAYAINAGVESYHDASLIDVTGATAHAKVAELTTRILDLLAEFRTEPVSGDELDKVVRRCRYDLAVAIDDPAAMAAWFGGTSLFYPPPPYEERLRRIEAVTPADIQRVARRVFSPERLVVVTVGSLTRARQGEVRAAVTGWA